MFQKYLDSKNELKFNSVLLLGENHTSSKDISDIQEIIRDFEPNVLAHELLYSDNVKPEDIIKRIKAPNPYYDEKINKDIYQMGYKIQCQLIGIDKENALKKYSFYEREQYMYSKIKNIMNTYKNVSIIVVVGDTHLRQTVSNVGLPSVLSKLSQELRVVCFRSSDMEVG